MEREQLKGIEKIKKMIKSIKKRQPMMMILTEDWDLLPPEYYWKYSDETIEELERLEIEELDRKIKELF